MSSFVRPSSEKYGFDGLEILTSRPAASTVVASVAMVPSLESCSRREYSVTTPLKVVKTEAEWRKQLGDLEFQVLRQAGTVPAWRSTWNSRSPSCLRHSASVLTTFSGVVTLYSLLEHDSRLVTMAKDATTVDAAGREVRISSPSKPYFPELGLTKLDIVSYVLAVGPGILAALRDRPVTMERWPEGVTPDASVRSPDNPGGSAFYQKHAPTRGIPDWVQTTTVIFPSGRAAVEVAPADLDRSTARREDHRGRLDPVRNTPGRRMLLVEGAATRVVRTTQRRIGGDAFGPAFHGDRAIAQGRQDARPDREHLGDDVELREAEFGEVRLRGARDPHLAARCVDRRRVLRHGDQPRVVFQKGVTA